MRHIAPSSRAVRVLAVSAAALAAVVAPWACAPPSSMKKAPYSPPAFVPEGWTYAVISPEPISAGYRLSLSVGFGATHGPEGAAPDGQGREEAPAAPAPAVSADRRAAPDAAPEFRLLLDRTGEASFVCLRWNAGYLEILRLVDGRPTGLVGQTFAEVPLARFADACLPVVMAGANGGPSAVSILVDRRPGLWSVTLGGEEVLTVGDPDGLPLGRRGADLPPASAPSRTETAAADGSGAGTAPAPFEPGVAWGATSGWSLLGRAVQPEGDHAILQATLQLAALGR